MSEKNKDVCGRNGKRPGVIIIFHFQEIALYILFILSSPSIVFLE
jgi:hypothetical protein